jgi:hypothetical protein
MKRTGEVSLKIVRSVTNYTVSIPVPYITRQTGSYYTSPTEAENDLTIE